MYIKPALISYFIWLASCILFLFITYSGGNTAVWSDFTIALFLITMLVGGVAFLFLFLNLIIGFLKKQERKKVLQLTLLSIISAALFFVVFVNLSTETTSARSINNQPQRVQEEAGIECFIDGISVITTRENCQELSKKNNQQAPVQVIQEKRVKMPPPPKVDLPKSTTTNCRADYDITGRYRGMNCTTY